MSESQPYPRRSPFRAGLACKCPRCGRGPLYAGFLTVCLYRACKGHFKPDHHFGLEAAAWYWHFVDVVWLFLFTAVYWWGSGDAPLH